MTFLRAIIFLVFTSAGLAATTWVSDGSQASVQGFITNNVTDGDTVTIPAGSFTWTSGVTCAKAITISGSGGGKTLAKSESSVAVGTGEKVFTLATEAVTAIAARRSQITNGATLRVWRSGGEIDNAGSPPFGITGNLPWMEGTVTSLTGDTLTMNITSTNHSGTHSVWSVMLPAATEIIHNAAGDSAVLFTLTESTAGSLRLSGIGFKHASGAQTENHLVVTAETTNGEPIIISDCSFNSTRSGSNGIRITARRGLVYDCTFAAFPFVPTNAGLYIKAAGYTTSWTTVSTMGNADTTGKLNIYVEDCDFQVFVDALDVDDNGRAVIRYCSFNSAGIGAHGADTSTYGQRHTEIYANEFAYSSPSNGALNLQAYFVPRGGTGLFYGNVLEDLNSSGLTDWGDKVEIGLQIQQLDRGSPVWSDNDGQTPEYHVPRQIGFGYITGSGVDGIGRTVDAGGIYVGDVEPLNIWGNTGHTLTIAVYDSGYNQGVSPDLAADYIVLDRDYKTSAKSGWTAYEYPHPLRGGTPAATATARHTRAANSVLRRR